MNNKYYRHIIALLAVLAFCINLSARQAKKGPITFSQPDGTKFVATLRGDEFMHLIITTNGNAVIQGDDEYYYYAYFDDEGTIHSSGIKVGEINPPIDVLINSSTIPTEKIRVIHERVRSSIQDIDDLNVIQKLFLKKESNTKSDSGFEKHSLVILVEFQDETARFKHSKSEFEALLSENGYSTNGGTGCVKDYFDTQFQGICSFTFDIFGPVTLKNKRSYYGENTGGWGTDSHPEEMVEEAVQELDSEIDFSRYDDDNDGVVDNIFIIFAGGDEADGLSSNYIWSHQGNVKLSKTFDGMTIKKYACTSELSYATGRAQMARIGTFCHEFSHTLGLMDLYDTNYGTDGQSDGLWASTALMDAGNMNNGGNTPPFYNAIEREVLGIGQCELLPNGPIQLEAINRSNKYYKILSDVQDEYYLLECRQAIEWDEFIGGQGLLVYHIDKSNNSAEGRLTAKQRWKYNLINANTKHQCADLIEANPNATSVKQVFFPYDSYDKLTTDGKTPIKWWNEGVANINITGITFADGKVTMTVSGDGSTDTPPSVKFGTKDVFQDAAVISFKSSYEYSGEATVQYGVTGKTQETIKVKPYSDGNYAVVLENLTPSTSYSVTVYFEKDGLVGASEKTSIMTASYSSKGLPYIYLKSVKKNDDGSFPANSKLPLRVYNKRGDVDGIVWYLNAIPIKIGSDGYYTIERSANIKAEVLYKDGSKDVIVKKIDLK